MKRLLYILPLLFAALVSCEREIPYNGEYEDPKLVIQTSLCAGEDNFICYVNRSYFFLEHTNPNDKEETIKNPTFEIYSAQNKSLQITSRIQSGNTHAISLSHPLQANDTIRLVVSHPTYGTAVAEEILMPAFEATLKSSVWEPKKKQCRFVFDFPTQYERPDLVLYMKSSLYFTVRTIVTKERNDTILSCDTTDYINEIIEQVISKAKIDLVELRIGVISTMACKASLKANRNLSMMEMYALLSDLLKCDNPYTCPHGRPTAIIYSTNELDKLFKRV